VAKKAKIDLLDIQINEPDRASSPDNMVPDGVNEDVRGAGKLARIWAWIGRLSAGRLKILLLLIPIFLAVAVAGGSIWLYLGKGTKAPVPPQGEVRETPIPAGGKVVVLDNFVVDVRDHKGDIRIAFCDIAVELEHPRAAGAADEQVELRNVIHAVLKRRPIVEVLSPQGRELIKIELKNELNRLLGEKAVRNVYITRFEVI